MWVEGNRKPVRTTAAGEYWRLLAPGGTYRMYAAAKGYVESRKVSVRVERGKWPPKMSIQMFK